MCVCCVYMCVPSRLDDGHAKVIASMMETCLTLEILQIRKNFVTNEGLSGMISSMAQNRSLKVLNILGNPLYSDRNLLRAIGTILSDQRSIIFDFVDLADTYDKRKNKNHINNKDNTNSRRAKNRD